MVQPRRAIALRELDVKIFTLHFTVFAPPIVQRSRDIHI